MEFVRLEALEGNERSFRDPEWRTWRVVQTLHIEGQYPLAETAYRYAFRCPDPQAYEHFDQVYCTTSERSLWAFSERELQLLLEEAIWRARTKHFRG